jgi:hypothetical protein
MLTFMIPDIFFEFSLWVIYGLFPVASIFVITGFESFILKKYSISLIKHFIGNTIFCLVGFWVE